MRATQRITLICTALTLAFLLNACDRLGNPREKAAAYLAKGDLAAARIEGTNAVENDPNDAEAYVVLGQVLAAQGDLAIADRTLAKAAQLGADQARVDGLRARVLLRSQAYQRILAELNPAPAHQGEVLGLVLAARGQAQLAMRQPAEAKTSFEGALKALPELPEALLGQAQLAYIDKDAERAMVLIERVIATTPRHPGAWELKAELLQLQGKIDEAVGAFEQAATHDPTNITPDLAAAELLIDNWRFDAAQKHVDRALKRSPNALLGHHVQAVLHFRQKNYDKALVVAQEILKAQPKFAPTILLLGMTHLARGELNQAEDRLRLIVQARPSDLLARKLYATTLMRMGNTKGALDTLAQALEKNTDDASLLTLVAEAHARAKDFAKATSYYEQAARRRPDRADAMARLGVAKYVGGHVEQGLAALEKAAALGSDSIGADFVLAMLLLERRDFKKALAIAQTIQTKQPQNPIGFNLAGVAQIGLRDPATATRSFERSADLDPSYWPAAANLARLDLVSGQQEGAKKRIQQVLAKNQTSIEAMTALVQITGDRGQFVESLEIARQADPKALVPRLVLARAYMAQGLGDRALPIAREAVAISPGRIDALEVLGTAQLAAARQSEALTTFRELATRAPKSSMAQVHLAQAQTALGDVRGAESAYAKAMALKPDDPAAIAGLARLYGSSRRFEEAMNLAERLQRTQPKSALGHVLAGDLSFDNKRYPEAVKAYDAAFALAPSGELVVKRHAARASAGDRAGDEMLRQWLKRYPNDIAVRLHLANQHYLTEQYREAIDQYGLIVKADPNHALALNNLASAYLMIKDARALLTAEAAHKLKPDDASILDTLGVAQMHYGKAEDAVATLRKAIARSPDAAESRMHYAIALARSGDKASARAELQKLVGSGKHVSFDAEAKALLGSR